MRQHSAWLLDLISDKKVRTEYIEYIIAQLNIQLVQDLDKRKITLREAEEMLYNLDVAHAITRRKLSRDCTEILTWGMQLEDLEDLEFEATSFLNALRKFSQNILVKTSSSNRTRKQVRTVKRSLATA